MKVNHRHYILIILAIGAFILSILVYVFVYRTVISQAKKSAELSLKVSQDSERKKHEEDLQSIYDNTSSDREKIKSFLISQDKVVNFIEEIEKIGKDTDTDLSISSINAEDLSAKAEGETGYLTAIIETKGKWQNVMRAFELIENIPYSTSLNNVRLEAGKVIPSGLQAPSKSSTKEKITASDWVLSVEIKALMSK